MVRRWNILQSHRGLTVPPGAWKPWMIAIVLSLLIHTGLLAVLAVKSHLRRQTEAARLPVGTDSSRVRFFAISGDDGDGGRAVDNKEVQTQIEPVNPPLAGISETPPPQAMRRPAYWQPIWRLIKSHTRAFPSPPVRPVSWEAGLKSRMAPAALSAEQPSTRGIRCRLTHARRANIAGKAQPCCAWKCSPTAPRGKSRSPRVQAIPSSTNPACGRSTAGNSCPLTPATRPFLPSWKSPSRFVSPTARTDPESNDNTVTAAHGSDSSVRARWSRRPYPSYW
jgi:hypothetical protein